MKRVFHIVVVGCIIGMMAANTVFANPARQSDPTVLTPDNLDSLALLGVFYNDNSVFDDVFVSPDGRAATISGQNLAQVWEIDPASATFGDPLFSQNLEAEACEGTCQLTAIALKGNHLAVGTLNGITLIFDIDTGDLLLMHREHQGYRINDIIVDSAGERFISIDAYGTLAYGVQMGENSFFQERTWLTTNSPLLAVAADPSSNMMAVAGGSPLVDNPNTTIYVWNTDDISPSVSILPITELVGSERPVYALAFSTDGSLLVSGEGDEFSDEATLRLWDVETGQLIATITGIPDLNDGVSTESITFSPDGSLLGVNMGGTLLYVWETSSLPTSGSLSIEGTNYYPLGMGNGDTRFSADGRFIVTNSFDVVQVWGIWLDE